MNRDRLYILTIFIFFLSVLVACQPKTKEIDRNFLINLWTVNHAEEGGTNILTGPEGATVQFKQMYQDVVLKRYYSNRVEHFIGKWELSTDSLFLRFISYESFRLIFNAENKDLPPKESILLDSKEMVLDASFRVKELNKFLLKLDSDTLRYNFVPKL